MVLYFSRRLLGTVPVLLGVTVLVFLLLKLVPGDPVVALLGEDAQGVSSAQLDQLRQAYGFNDPWLTQYARFLSDFVTGQLLSLKTQTPVLTEILQRFPYTLQLTALALGLSVLVALPLGTVAALRRHTLWDTVITSISLLGVSIPSFWFAILAMTLFALQLRWLPPSGSGTLAHLVLPALTLAFGSVAIQIRMMRASLLDALPQDYVRTARAKGLPPIHVLRHALRNALVPVLTVIGLEFGGLLGGAVITESIFAWPGLGRLTLDAVTSRDIPLVQGVVVFSAAVFTVVNLVVDMLYGVLNPRVQYD